MSEVAQALLEDPRRLDRAATWFDRAFNPAELDSIERYRLAQDRRNIWLGAGAIELAHDLGVEAAVQYKQAWTDYNAVLERAREQHFPEALKTRDPNTTPLIVLGAYVPVHPEQVGESIDTLPLVRKLKGDETAGGIHGSSSPERLAEVVTELNGANIVFKNLDDSYFEKVNRVSHFSRLRVDDLAEEEVIGLFGLNREEHGQAETVLIYDSKSGRNSAKLAELVRDRTGKYPHFAYVKNYGDFYEPHHGWVVHEYVPLPPRPERPTLQAALTARLAKAAMH